MSRLSRFKKAPVIKLPAKLEVVGNFDEDSSEDDDFVKRPVIPTTGQVAPAASCSTKRRSDEESVSSEYFLGSSELTSMDSDKRKGDAIVDRGRSMQTRKNTADLKSNLIKTEDKIGGQSSIDIVVRRNLEEAQENQPQEEVDLPVFSESSEDVNNKVVCPFCWKKLGDKLTGTTHVKSCAKDLSINRVFQAIQLQEKQIQEWEKLGLAFPGFSNNAAKKPTKGRGGGSRRKKKEEDPQLQLAIALSESLHEEVKTRKLKENRFIIEHGLEQEIELSDVQEGPCSSGTTKNALANSSPTDPPVAGTVCKRRGKKLELKHLPLFTTDSLQKKMIVSERVTRILEESDTGLNESFYIRDKIPSDEVGVPKSLKSVVNDDSPLWNLAQSTEAVPDKSFSILEIKQPPEVLEMSTNLSIIEENHQISLQEEEKKTENVIRNETPFLGDIKEKEFMELSIETQLTDRLPQCVTGNSINKLNNFKKKRKSSKPSTSRNNPSLEKLPPVIQDIARMFLDRQGDIVMYGREEKPIRCHRFMLSARCPKLLGGVIVERSTSKSGEEELRHIISLTDYDHKTLKAFMWYIYTGCIETSEETIRNDLRTLGRTYGITVTTNTKTKSVPKVKLPARIPPNSSKEKRAANVPLTCPNSNGKNDDQRPTSSGSPTLNYSLIDTPVLTEAANLPLTCQNGTTDNQRPTSSGSPMLNYSLKETPGLKEAANLPLTCANGTIDNQRPTSSGSPMLNYSLIDTPVLKQELKKFGIRPLPRSKAKVLLRHIHKETHK